LEKATSIFRVEAARNQHEACSNQSTLLAKTWDYIEAE
jgi:hypothetical protein